MKDLIEALRIFLKYGNPHNPTHCKHDSLWIAGIVPDEVSVDDKVELDRLGFFVDEMEDGFKSYRYGSA